MGKLVSNIARQRQLSFEDRAWLWGLCAVLECMAGDKPTDDQYLMAAMWLESNRTRAALQGRG